MALFAVVSAGAMGAGEFGAAHYRVGEDVRV